jgi:ABC-type Fe3+-hydroxamate transport system substrate-binding protein
MISLTDDLGFTVRLPHLPKRIVSLVPSITLTLHDLGVGEQVVGRTTFCIHPEPAVNKAMTIGGTKKLHIEKILALQPDLVLANKEENEQEQVEEIAKVLPVFMTDTKDLRGNQRLLEHLGVLTGKGAEAKFINDNINSGFVQLAQQISKITPLRVLYVIWKKPYMSVGSDTFIHHIMEQAGCINVFDNKRRYPEFTLEEVAQLKPDVVLLSSEPYPFKEKHLPAFREIIPEAKVLLADGEAFSWYGSRMLSTPGYLLQLRKIMQID